MCGGEGRGRSRLMAGRKGAEARPWMMALRIGLVDQKRDSGSQKGLLGGGCGRKGVSRLPCALESFYNSRNCRKQSGTRLILTYPRITPTPHKQWKSKFGLD